MPKQYNCPESNCTFFGPSCLQISSHFAENNRNPEIDDNGVAETVYDNDDCDDDVDDGDYNDDSDYNDDYDEDGNDDSDDYDDYENVIDKDNDMIMTIEI